MAPEEFHKLKADVQGIKDRNRRVEADKAWETSWSRNFAILVLTYIVAVIALFMIDAANPMTGAIIPTLGFFLSIQTLPFLKRWWLKNYLKKNSRP